MSLKKNLCGILLCTVIAVIATFLSSLKIGSFALELIGAPVMSILFGLLISFAVPPLLPLLMPMTKMLPVQYR